MQVLEDEQPRFGPEVPSGSDDEVRDGALELLALEPVFAGLPDAEERSPDAHVRLQPLARVLDDALELGPDDFG
jgi:hypothetical protein